MNWWLIMQFFSCPNKSSAFYGIKNLYINLRHWLREHLIAYKRYHRLYLKNTDSTLCMYSNFDTWNTPFRNHHQKLCPWTLDSQWGAFISFYRFRSQGFYHFCSTNRDETLWGFFTFSFSERWLTLTRC